MIANFKIGEPSSSRRHFAFSPPLSLFSNFSGNSSTTTEATQRVPRRHNWNEVIPIPEFEDSDSDIGYDVVG